MVMRGLLGPGLEIGVLWRTLGHGGVLRCEEFHLNPVKELETAWSFIFPCEEESATQENSGSSRIFRKAALEMEP